MRVVFQENPKFGDEQDVAQQIISIDEHIEKLHAEIKRFEVILSIIIFVEYYTDCFCSLVLYRGNRTTTCRHFIRI